MLIGFNRTWWGGLPPPERPSFGHSALPSNIRDLERLRAHMLAERHAWDDGRAYLRQTWEELRNRVLPPRPTAAEPPHRHAAFEDTVWILPTMDGMIVVCCCDTSLAYRCRRRLSACVG